MPDCHGRGELGVRVERRGRRRRSARLATKFGIVARSSASSQPSRIEAVDHPVGQHDEVPAGRQAGVRAAGQVGGEELLVAVDDLDVVDLDAGLGLNFSERRVAGAGVVDVDVADQFAQLKLAGRRELRTATGSPLAAGVAAPTVGRRRRRRPRTAATASSRRRCECARNAPSPTAATATTPPDEELPSRDAGRRWRGRSAARPRRGTAATGTSGGGVPPASTAKVWSGDQVRRTSSPGSHSSARVARSTFCS